MDRLAGFVALMEQTTGMTLVPHPTLSSVAAELTWSNALHAVFDLTAISQNPAGAADGDGRLVVTTDDAELSFWPGSPSGG